MSPSSTKPGTSVLFIDDDADLLEMLQMMFERKRTMTVRTALSATEALGILRDASFDAIVVDLDMPGMSGLDFLRLLRKQGNTTPIILFTGVGGEHTAIEALNNGADFLVKKGEDPRFQFAHLEALVRQSAEKRNARKMAKITQKIVTDLMTFFSEPCFAVDEKDRVIVWNESMEHLTGVPARELIGKNGDVYAIPFFGTKRRLLVNLVFENDAEINRQKYMLVSRVKDRDVVAVTRGTKLDGTDWVLWMKAMPVYDESGVFVATIGTIRDITATFGDIVIHDSVIREADELADLALPEPEKVAPGLFNRILARPSALYEKGLILFIKGRRFKEALEAFDAALAIDASLPHIWNDRGECLLEMGDFAGALASITRAADMEPENPEYLFSLGVIREKVGVLHMSNKELAGAIQSFQEVVRLVPGNTAAWNHLGICFREMGKAEESKFYFERAREITFGKRDTPIKRKRDEVL